MEAAGIERASRWTKRTEESGTWVLAWGFEYSAAFGALTVFFEERTSKARAVFLDPRPMNGRYVEPRVPGERPVLRYIEDMLNTRLATVVVAILVATGACRNRDDEVKPTGEALFVRHCASCHGLSGEGNGPLAQSLHRSPTDLTTIAKRSGGRFDDADVMAVIDGRRLIAEHGPREMPVWGAVFEEEHVRERYGSLAALYHGRALTDYLRSIQAE